MIDFVCVGWWVWLDGCGRQGISMRLSRDTKSRFFTAPSWTSTRLDSNVHLEIVCAILYAPYFTHTHTHTHTHAHTHTHTHLYRNKCVANMHELELLVSLTCLVSTTCTHWNTIFYYYCFVVTSFFPASLSALHIHIEVLVAASWGISISLPVHAYRTTTILQ